MSVNPISTINDNINDNTFTCKHIVVCTLCICKLISYCVVVVFSEVGRSHEMVR